MSFYGKARGDAGTVGAPRYHSMRTKMAGAKAIARALSVVEELKKADATEEERLRAAVLAEMPEVAAMSPPNEAPVPRRMPMSSAKVTRPITGNDLTATPRPPALLQSVLVISAAAVAGSFLLGLVMVWLLSAMNDVFDSDMMGPMGLIVLAVVLVIALVLWCVALVPPAAIAAYVNGRFIDGMVAAAAASQLTVTVFLIFGGGMFRDGPTSWIILVGSLLWGLALSFPAAAAGHGLSVLLRRRKAGHLVSTAGSSYGDAAKSTITADDAAVPVVRKRPRRPTASAPIEQRQAVYCDECGASNLPGRARCLLCGAWLHERA